MTPPRPCVRVHVSFQPMAPTPAPQGLRWSPRSPFCGSPGWAPVDPRAAVPASPPPLFHLSIQSRGSELLSGHSQPPSPPSTCRAAHTAVPVVCSSVSPISWGSDSKHQTWLTSGICLSNTALESPQEDPEEV